MSAEEATKDVSTAEDSVPVQPETATTTDAPAPTADAPADEPSASKEEAVDEPAETEAAPAEGEAPKSASSPTKKKIARPGKPRPSVPAGGSKKKGDGAASGAGDNKSFEFGDIVLARLRGYPPWPARVTDPKDLPQNVISQRPGKSPSIYCVQFFPVGDFSWLQSRDISHLRPNDISAFLDEPHRKKTPGGLKEAYETAQDPTEWDIAEKEKRAAREAASAVGPDVDELDEDDEEVVASGGKRKRAAESSAKGSKSKKAKPGKKISAAEVESEEEDAPKSKKAAKPKAAPKAKAESKPAVENQPPAEDDPLASDPECVKVKDWRHKLQRAFLGKGLPTAEEMSGYDDLFKTIEGYKEITIEALQYSKIGKVMKKIATLDGIPRNSDLNITGRATSLMQDWQKFIESKGQTNGDAASKTNGDDAAKEAPKAEEKTEDAANGDGDKMEVEA